MFSHTISIRVKYADTDQMGYVYYGRYLEYLEVARTEAIRHLGLTYNELERDYSVALPVMDVAIRYLRPARYDDVLILRTSIQELPGVRIKFHTDIERDEGETISQADVRLCFIDMNTERPTRPPQAFMDKVVPYFD